MKDSSILERISEIQTSANGRIFALPMSVKDIVTVEGSVLGGWRLMPKDKEEAAVLAARLFDAGTKRTSKDKLRSRVEDRGASLSFSVGPDRTYFSLSCLPEDLPNMLRTVVECLTEPLLDKKEFEASRKRLVSGIKNQSHSTSKQARIAFKRSIYDPKHPNYPDSDEERLSYLSKLTVADVRAFHQQIGKGGLVLSIVGDIDAIKVLPMAEKAFSGMKDGILEAKPYAPNAKKPKAFEQRIPIAKKANIDVYLGVALPITYGQPMHRPTQLFGAMLGDGGTGHLMSTVRDRDGLTYGIYAGLTGVMKLHDGHFYISASFAPELFDLGVKTTKQEIQKLITKGITASAVAKRKEELVGSYWVGLSTTSSMADALHAIGTRGQKITHLTAFPDELEAVSVSEVKKAAAAIPFDKMSIVGAGTFDKAKKTG